MRAYLLANAALYALFAVWCTIKPASTATSLGYLTRNAAGESEYLVIYGGLQFGLAAFFWWTARETSTYATGLVFALCLYAPIVVYRVITVIKGWPIPGLTLSVAALEIGLLVWGLLLARRVF